MTNYHHHNSAPPAWLDELPVTNRYTFGLAGERFFREFKNEGRILGTRCKKCGLTYVPAAAFCERCLGELDEWVDVGLSGPVHTFTLLHVDYNGNQLDELEIVAFVSFGDGGLIHRLGDIHPEQVRIGLVVEAVFKPKDEREGSIKDILYFKPVY